MVADVDTASPRLYWFHTDQLGTPQKLTDQAGNLAWDAVLEPFGELASLTVNLVAQPLRLQGQYADPTTGLHQNWWRDYDPGIGRYLQPDPLGIRAGTNLYLYAGANPVSLTDPDGQNTIALGAGGGAAVAGLPGAVVGALGAAGASLCALSQSCRQAIARVCSPLGDIADRLFSEEGDKVEVRTTRQGKPGVRITRPDGTVVDITPDRVREFVPEPRARSGLRPKSFDDALPGSKGKKRRPTGDELDLLDRLIRK